MDPIVWQYVSLFFIAFSAVMVFLFAWRRREIRRTRAMEVADELSNWGLDQLSRLLRAYVIGNYLGADSVTRVLHEIIDELVSGGLPAMLRKVGWKIVKGVFLKSADDRAELTRLLAAAAIVEKIETPTP
jgi:hypothetical protein